MKFKCTVCGQEHDTGKISFGATEPVMWHHITENERRASMLASDQCEIESKEGRSHYIRGCIEIPIKGTREKFIWTVWCWLSGENYREMGAHWQDPQRAKLPPYPGWLCTRLPEYTDTAGLKTLIHQREMGLRPLVELEPADHPLSLDQRMGIAADRLQQIITKLLH